MNAPGVRTALWLGVIAAASAAACGVVRPEAVELPVTAATVRGTVVDAQTGEPVRAATVTVSQASCYCVFGRGSGRGASGHYEVVTQPDGTYEIRGVVPGSYVIDARAATRYGATHLAPASTDQVAARNADGSPMRPAVQVQAGVVADIVLQMDRRSSISGRVLDGAGLPVNGMTIEVLRVVPGSSPVVAAIDQTEGGGDFQVRVPTGEYYVRGYPHAERRGEGRAVGTYVPTFYPGVQDIEDADTIIVAPEQDVIAVDFVIRGRTQRSRAAAALE